MAYKAKPIEKRFWHKVDKTGDCWLWLGHKSSKGYGGVQVDGLSKKAHRVAYELVNGPIPEGLYACHTCDNPSCVNPAHIFLGTQHENMADMVAKGRLVSANERKAHCKHGHEFTPENTHMYKGWRECRACRKNRQQAKNKPL